MIFVTVGTQLPFERMLRQVDTALTNIDMEVVYQVGPSEYKPSKGILHEYMSSEEYKLILSKSDVVIGHAGMGTIITSLEYSIPVILFPRMHELNEHRNDHQVATANKFGDTNGVFVANTSDEIILKLNEIKNMSCRGAFSDGNVRAFAEKLLPFIC
jgi:UDP-N-acetylglucosamine transferase subunit ALG13